MDRSDQPAASPQVLAQTDEWLVVGKPAGWLTIPGRQSSAPILSEWAAREHGAVWIVHRLDRETSGVCLLARTAQSHRKASLWFQKHEVRKAYDFISQGALHAPLLKVKHPIEGAPSVTQIESRENFASSSCFLGRAVPLTGRRHQIRIHLAREGHPILGDLTYEGPRSVQLRGDPTRIMSVERVALHAARLELPSREVFEAPWPSDFAGWVQALRQSMRQESQGERAHVSE